MEESTDSLEGEITGIKFALATHTEVVSTTLASFAWRTVDLLPHYFYVFCMISYSVKGMVK